jgi:GntR family transcriptional regulator
MDERAPVRQPSLSSQIVDILVDKIRKGKYPPDSPLPPENQLASEFDVSRTTIRGAFDRLEAMGLIARRQGVGTFVRRTSNISNPLNKFVDFYSLIRDNGFEPSYRQISARMLVPPDEIQQDLQLEKDQLALEIHKVFLADNTPIIYCTNWLPEWVFQDYFSPEEILLPGIIEPNFTEFFEIKCRQPLKYFISDVRSDVLKNCPTPESFLGMDPLTPILIINEIGFNEQDRPVIQSIEYHPGNRMKFQLIRLR